MKKVLNANEIRGAERVPRPFFAQNVLTKPCHLGLFVDGRAIWKMFPGDAPFRFNNLKPRRTKHGNQSQMQQLARRVRRRGGDHDEGTDAEAVPEGPHQGRVAGQADKCPDEPHPQDARLRDGSSTDNERLRRHPALPLRRQRLQDDVRGGADDGLVQVRALPRADAPVRLAARRAAIALLNRGILGKLIVQLDGHCFVGKIFHGFVLSFNGFLWKALIF